MINKGFLHSHQDYSHLLGVGYAFVTVSKKPLNLQVNESLSEWQGFFNSLGSLLPALYRIYKKLTSGGILFTLVLRSL